MQVCKTSHVKIFKRLVFPQVSLNFKQLYCKYVGHEGIQAVTVFGDLPKFKNFMLL